MFIRTGTTWTQQQKLTAADATTADHFGGEVALSGDGVMVLVGARGDADAGPWTGAAYVFMYGITPPPA